MIADLYEPVWSDPRFRELLAQSEAVLARLRAVPFEPDYPPALQARIDALRAATET